MQHHPIDLFWLLLVDPVPPALLDDVQLHRFSADVPQTIGVRVGGGQSLVFIADTAAAAAPQEQHGTL